MYYNTSVGCVNKIPDTKIEWIQKKLIILFSPVLLENLNQGNQIATSV